MGYHIITIEDRPDLRLCYDDDALGVECAWLLDVSGEQAIKIAAWNERLNGWIGVGVTPELAAYCDILLKELFERLGKEMVQ
jgi:hypothetical protein